MLVKCLNDFLFYFETVKWLHSIKFMIILKRTNDRLLDVRSEMRELLAME